jgi:hypothetical protein
VDLIFDTNSHYELWPSLRAVDAKVLTFDLGFRYWLARRHGLFMRIEKIS